MVLLTENGARRGPKVRCPSCTRFNAPGLPCPECGCGPVPPERYGAARMLFHAGVDRFALMERLEALAPSQVEHLEAQYATLWTGVRRLLEDVRRWEPDLLLGGFPEEVEDLWARWLPWRVPSLEAGDDWSPVEELRWLEALAAMNRGETSPAQVSAAVSCLHDEGRFGLEAALALTRWRVWPYVRLSRQGRERIQQSARVIAARYPEHEARAAVAWVRAAGREPEVDILFTLRKGLHHPDADVRFECALCLEDEDGLLAALDSPDARVASEARRRLAARGSAKLLDRLSASGDADFARDVLKRLPTSAPPGTLGVLLAVSARVKGGLAGELHGWATGTPFAELTAEDQTRWATWARSTLRELPAEDALRFLEWAAAAPDAGDSEAVRAFESAAAEALARATPPERARLLRGAEFVRFLSLAGPGETPLLHIWSRQEACAEPLLDTLASLTGRMDRWGQSTNGQAARLLMAVWAPPARERLLGPLAEAVRSWSGISGREELIEAVWRRFQESPEERADLLTTFEPWRRELWERQCAAEPDPLARFETWWRVDAPTRLPERVNDLVRESPMKVEDLPRRLARVWAAAESRVDAWPRSTSLAVSYAAAVLSGELRSGADALAPEAERFLAWFPDFERRVLAAPPAEGESSYHRHFLEDLHVDVRLMRERLVRLREDAERAREEELRRKVAESRRRDEERRAEAARLDAERRAEEARIHSAKLLASLPPVTTVLPLPGVPGLPIDDEVILDGARLPTLMHYVRLLKAMSGGADVLALFAAHGLTVETWTVECNAWGQAMIRRPDLAMRFGALMAAPWG
jgi:hypothetical protein